MLFPHLTLARKQLGWAVIGYGKLDEEGRCGTQVRSLKDSIFISDFGRIIPLKPDYFFR